MAEVEEFCRAVEQLVFVCTLISLARNKERKVSCRHLKQAVLINKSSSVV